MRAETTMHRAAPCKWYLFGVRWRRRAIAGCDATIPTPVLHVQQKRALYIALPRARGAGQNAAIRGMRRRPHVCELLLARSPDGATIRIACH
jgi:hypothetical protein